MLKIDEDKIFYSKPQDIIIPEDFPRYRKDAVNLEKLLKSILEKGQLHPIVVTENLELIAGGRRLAACLLGNIKVRYTFKANLTPIQIREIELEENLQREDLSPADEADAIADLHELKQQIYGQSISGRKGGWRLSDTADSIGKTKGNVIDNIQISKALEDFPELRELKTKKAIKKAVKGCELVAERAAASHEWAITIAKEGNVDVVFKDATLDMPKIPDGLVDILLTDPKYGIDIDKIGTSIGGTTGGLSTSGYKYDDSPDDALRLYRLLAPESYRFTAENAHAWIFVAPEFFVPIRNMMIKAGWQAHIKPIIWIKRESGQCNMPEMWPSSCYEMILYCRKATSRLVVQGMPDWIQEDPVLESKRLHISEKPIPLLRKLLIRTSLPGQRLYDPFMGSGSSLEAGLAQKLIVRGCDIDVNAYNATNKRISDFIKESGR